MEQAQEEVRESVEYDDGVEETAEAPETEATEETEQPEETPEERKARIEFTEEQQEYINNHIVARQVAKRKEAERELEELRAKAQQFEQQQQPDGRPVIPDPPNIWDDNYEEKVKARDEAIREAAAWDAQEQARQEWEQRQAYEQQQKEQQQLLERVGTYTNRAKEFGIDEKDLQVAGNAVAQFGIPEPLIQYILDDDAGPAITMHLSRNFQELAELNQMDPIRAAVYVATQIKPRAERNAKRRSAPPEPVDNPRGGGVPEKDRGPAGATYE